MILNIPSMTSTFVDLFTSLVNTPPCTFANFEFSMRQTFWDTERWENLFQFHIWNRMKLLLNINIDFVHLGTSVDSIYDTLKNSLMHKSFLLRYFTIPARHLITQTTVCYSIRWIFLAYEVHLRGGFNPIYLCADNMWRYWMWQSD